MSDVYIEKGPPILTFDELQRRVADYLSGTRVERAIVFGSYAKGTADAASDVDLVLIEPTSTPFIERGLAHLPLFDLGVGIDLLVYTPEEYARLRSNGNGLIGRVETEGRTLYERA
jgi:predicted nucleotidyltransferase